MFKRLAPVQSKQLYKQHGDFCGKRGNPQRVQADFSYMEFCGLKKAIVALPAKGVAAATVLLMCSMLML